MSTNHYGLPSPLTEQAIFDKVATHLLRQGFKSIRDTKRVLCGYRGRDGGACAVGVLISDDDYSPAMEGAMALSVIELQLPALAPFKFLLQSLQDVHDDTACDKEGNFVRDELITALRSRAERYHLSPAVLYAAVPAQPWAAPKAIETPPALPASITRLLAPEPTPAAEEI